MAQMIPAREYVEFDEKRNGERIIFDKLAEDGINGTAYYSLKQKNQKHKIMAEADFVFVSERGILCLEIKGGKVDRKDRVWTSTNKLGKAFEIHDPFEQARLCSHAVKDLFADSFGRYDPKTNCIIGYAVVFPECIFNGESNEIVTNVMFDGKKHLDEFGTFLEKCFEHWESEEIAKHNFKPQKLTKDELRSINDLIRADFRSVPTMSIELEYAEKSMKRLTEEQFYALDEANFNPRVLVRGVAGTGKTILALERVRQCAAYGKKTLYVCYNSNMAYYALNSLGAKRPNVKATTFHALLTEVLKDDAAFTDSVDDISKKFLNLNPEHEKYDYCVMDEGQDLIRPASLDVLDRFIEKGLKNGKWMFFYDPNQNIFNRNDEFEFAENYIMEEVRPSVKLLDTNCRNTEQIARKTTVLTHVPQAKKIGPRGPTVAVRKFETKKEFLSLIKQDLQNLLVSGTYAEDIVILSKFNIENSLLNDSTELCNHKIFSSKKLHDFKNNALNYFTIQSFKGLESKIVFLIDIDGFADTSSRLLNYVAMSRAKIALYMYYDKKLAEEFNSVEFEGVQLL